jgi:Cof subfamily protein (haloacid dehalogenase superfamily)
MSGTLYVSDLDGTLLTPEKKVSENTVSILNRLLEKGLLFTVATARSSSTAGELLRALHLTLPGVLLNGALLYDFVHKRYVDCNEIAPEASERVLAILRKHDRIPMQYVLEEDGICVQFERLYNPEEEAFYEERRHKAYKRFCQVERLSPDAGRVIYYTMIDTRERLMLVSEELKPIQGIRHVMYRDVYSQLYFLEIFSDRASKSNGMKRVQALCGADKVTAFGDNFNDVDMLRAADTALVVSDGVTEVKAMASQIIGPSTEDGVARYLEQDFAKNG